MQIKRRDFLKLGVAAGGAAAMGAPVLNAFALKPGAALGYGRTDAGRWMPSTCQG